MRILSLLILPLRGCNVRAITILGLASLFLSSCSLGTGKAYQVRRDALQDANIRTVVEAVNNNRADSVKQHNADGEVINSLWSRVTACETRLDKLEKEKRVKVI